jgi:glycosyltransferase involved in cell wall biosynthesis
MRAADRVDPKPLRVLHVVGQMSRGGIETWLMHVLRHIDRERVAVDILVATNRPGDYDAEARALGAKVIVCTGHTRPWSYIPRIVRTLRREGPYDVVHSNVGYFSGVIMWAARLAGIPIRITHSHNTEHSALRATPLRRLYERLCRQLIHRYATAGVACSVLAAVPLFGKRWQGDARWSILYYGIDFTPFYTRSEHASLRRELGLPAGAAVVGHVGRFAPQKNHALLLEIFAKVSEQRRDARLLLVGDGPLRESIVQQAQRLGLVEKVVLAGVRSDVAELLSLMDVMVFPSHHEGLGLVLLEAQAAGLPSVITANLPEEGCVVPRLITRVDLSAPPSEWASAVVRVLSEPERRAGAAAAIEIMQASDFNIDVSMRRLLQLYGRFAT